MSDMNTCKQCGAQIPINKKGPRRTFCGSICNGNYRRALNRKKNKDMADRAEAVRERNTRLLEAYLTERRRRLARTKRMVA